MQITIPDLLEESNVDHTVRPIILGPSGSSGPITKGIPNDEEYYKACWDEKGVAY